MQFQPALKSIFCVAWKERRGVAALEFALIAPILALLVGAVFDIGNGVHERLLLLQALRAGGIYALAFPNQLGQDILPGTYNNGILLAVQQALPTQWTINSASSAVLCGPTNVNLSVSPDKISGPPPILITLTASLTNPYCLPFGSVLSPTGPVTYVIRVQ